MELAEKTCYTVFRGDRVKKYGWILALILLIVLIFTGIFLIFGNPVSLYLAQEGAEAYLAETYPEENAVVVSAGYDFVRPGYYARVETDREFTLYLDGWGTVYFDTHP